jgi:Tol biopolymer transport system component
LLVPVEHGEVRKLMSSPASEGRIYWPVFSAKGDCLAYSACIGSRACDIFLLDLDGRYVPKGRPRRVTRRGAVIEGIAWAPDGQSLVYAASADLGAGFRLWRVPASAGAEPERLELAGEHSIYPALSRTGNRLVYARSEWEADIWKYEAGAPPQRFLSSTRNELEPAFSPDGEHIAFATDRSGGGTELWLADRGGANLARLTRGFGGLLGHPGWSPDGRWIVFHAQGEDAHWHIYVIDSAGGQPRRVTPEPSDDSRPSWSRDGRWIFFNSNRTGRDEVYRVSPDGRERTQFTKEGGNSPMESQDGKTLYFTKGSRLLARRLGSDEDRQILESVAFGGWFVCRNGVYHIVTSGGPDPLGFEIRFLDFATGKDEVLHRSELQFIPNLTVSPDRKTILTGASVGQTGDLMMVDNFR